MKRVWGRILVWGGSVPDQRQGAILLWAAALGQALRWPPSRRWPPPADASSPAATIPGAGYNFGPGPASRSWTVFFPAAGTGTKGMMRTGPWLPEARPWQCSGPACVSAPGCWSSSSAPVAPRGSALSGTWCPSGVPLKARGSNEGPCWSQDSEACLGLVPGCTGLWTAPGVGVKGWEAHS